MRNRLQQVGQRLLDRLGLEVRTAVPVALGLAGQAGEPLTAAASGHGSVWVHACVSLIGRTVAAAPFQIRRAGRVVKEGAAVALFERPHPWLSRTDFFDLLTQRLLLSGRAHVVGLDATGSPTSLLRRPPVALLVLPPDRVRAQVSQGDLLGYRYSPGHDSPVRDTYLAPEEVVTLRLPSPFDLHDGQSPAAVAALAATTDAAAAAFMLGLMQNNGDTGVIVETDQQLTDEQRQHVLAALRERKRAAGTADRPLLLWGGLKVAKPALSSTDLQFLENRKFARQEICAVFGVPQELLGLTEDANRSVASGTRAQFIHYTVAPLAQRIAAGLAPLVRLFGRDLVGTFDLDALPVLRSAQRERFAVAAVAQQMGVPLRTVNQVFNLGLPSLPGDGDALRPFGVQKVGEMADSTGNAFERMASLLAKRQNAPGAKSPHGHRTLGRPRAGRAGSDILQAGSNAA